MGLEFGKHVCVGGGCHGYVLMTIDVKSGDDISEESGGSIEESVGGSPLWKPPLLGIGQKTRLFFKPSDTFLATPFLPH